LDPEEDCGEGEEEGAGEEEYATVGFGVDVNYESVRAEMLMCREDRD
jgi:hypothetical protein